MLPKQSEVLDRAKIEPFHLVKWLQYVSAKQVTQREQEITLEQLARIRVIEKLSPGALLRLPWNEILEEKGLGAFVLSYEEESELEVCQSVLQKRGEPGIPFQGTAMRNFVGDITLELGAGRSLPAARRRIIQADLTESAFESQANVALRQIMPSLLNGTASREHIQTYQAIIQLRKEVGLRLQDILVAR